MVSVSVDSVDKFLNAQMGRMNRMVGYIHNGTYYITWIM